MTHNKLKNPNFFKNIMFTIQVLSQKLNKLPITSTDLEVVPCVMTDGRADIATSRSAMWLQAVRWAKPPSSFSSKTPWPSRTITSALHCARVCPGTQRQQSYHRTAYQQVSKQVESSSILFRLQPVLGNVVTLSGTQTVPAATPWPSLLCAFLVLRSPLHPFVITEILALPFHVLSSWGPVTTTLVIESPSIVTRNNTFLN
jgi:hypothetical protein